MNGWRALPGRTLRLTLLSAAALAAAAPAFCERAVELSFKEAQGYGRITAKWADGDETAPKITAAVAGNDQVLILRFDQKVAVDLDALKKGLPSWAAAARMDADGATVRVGLKQASRVHLSSSVDLAAIDLLPKSAAADPPDIISPLAAQKAREAEARRLAAIPPPPKIEELEVRGSHAGESSRIAFYWPERVSYRVVAHADGTLKLLFERRAKADLAYLHIMPPPNLEDFQAENTDKGYLVSIVSKDKIPIKHFFEGDVVVIDITRPAPPAPPDEATAKSASPAPSKPDPPIAEDKPILLAPPKAEPSFAETEPAAPLAPPGPTVIGGAERVSSLSPNWRDPAPRSGVVDVRATPIGNGLELEAAFAAPAPAAVFSRGAAVWAVFAANADLKVDQTTLPHGFRVRTMRAKDATLMRIEGPKGLTVSAEAEESAWKIRLAPSALRPHRFLKIERKGGDGERARIEAMLVGAAGLVWFEDPVVGDLVAAVVAYGPSSASTTPRDYVEAALPATAHGLAIAPRSENVMVTLEGERVVVSMAVGVQNAPTQDDAASLGGSPGFVDFIAWAGDADKPFIERQSRMEAFAAEADISTPEGAKAVLDLARFYVANDLDFEALGVLKVAASDRPEIEQEPAFLGLRGVANYKAGRHAEAEQDFSKGALRNDPSVAAWRAMVAVEMGEWERAGELFRAAGKQLQAYPPERAAEFAAAWSEAALNANDYDVARRQAEMAIDNGAPEVKERGEFILASLKAITDGPAAAYSVFETLSREASEPVAVRAELRRLELGVAAGLMTANDAAGELESLRYRWRGDGVEMATVGILADQYMRVGRFRDALQLAQSTAMRDVRQPGSRELRIKLSDYFRRLFLNGEADRLDPIQALALFYEFADELMPIGSDGDQMTRKLAQRLVAFDLLEPAAQLLQYQVDNRLRGVSKSAIAVDLATVYLWDKRPERALAAINTTRIPGLPKDLALERRMLEAAAYRDLGRYDHVVELVQPLDGVEAQSLLAEAYWRDRKWPEAARAFMSMLPEPGAAAAKDVDLAFKAAIAARMSKDPGLISGLRPYAPLFEGNPRKASFDLITSQTDISGAAFSEAVRRLADAPRVDAFAEAMKARFEAAKTTPSPQPVAAAPSAQTGGSR